MNESKEIYETNEAKIWSARNVFDILIFARGLTENRYLQCSTRRAGLTPKCSHTPAPAKQNL